jgi:hypothetical protein
MRPAATSGPAEEGRPIHPSIAIVGAASPIGQFLIKRCRDYAIVFHAIGRHARRCEDDRVHSFDERSGRFDPPIRAAGAVITCAPLPTIDRVMQMADCLNASRVLAFGSTGRFSKSTSSTRVERDFVSQQIEAEQRYEARSRQQGIAWTLFRPTMIYGAGSDLNVAFIGKFIRRFGFFPVPRGADGLRQPVHADDLASACLAALGCARTFGRPYNLGGGERLGYAEMVARIFGALHLRPRRVTIPFWAYKRLVQMIRTLPRFRYISPDMVDRMRVDLIADHSDAQRDFGYAPRPFFPTSGDILGAPTH